MSELKKKKLKNGTSLAVQWLRLQASTAGGVGSISGGVNKIMHDDVWCGKKKKKGLRLHASNAGGLG